MLLVVASVGLQNFPSLDTYVKALLEARKGKNLTYDTAVDAVTNDPNMFGVMMVAMGDAGGMVSGSIHTTAATIRPAMQVLKTPNLVSSVFFMCLPDKVRTAPVPADRWRAVRKCFWRQSAAGLLHCCSVLTTCATRCAGAGVWRLCCQRQPKQQGPGIHCRVQC